MCGILIMYFVKLQIQEIVCEEGSIFQEHINEIKRCYPEEIVRCFGSN